MNRRVVMSAAGAGLAAVALLAWFRSGGQADRAGASDVVTVTPRAFAATVSAIGVVEPQIGAEVRVGSLISGRVRRLRANIGDAVAKGQIIAELETEVLDALIAQRSAELKVAEAQRAEIETLAPDELAQAEAQLARFEATAKLASGQWERQQTLFHRRMATQAEVDAAQEQNAVAHAELESARRSLELVRAGNAERMKQAVAEEERSRAALQSALVDRSFTMIRSPISGIVASVSTQEGETVAAGLSAPTFVTIVDLDRLQVNAYVDEVDIGKIQPGQSAAFTVDAFPARDFTGRVTAIYPTATIQDNVVKYVVVLGIEDAYGGMLRPEMTTSVRIQLEAREVLALPTRAVRRVDGRNVVYVLEDGQPRERVIRVGWRDGAWIEIVEGLVEGERVMLEAPAEGR